MSAERKLKALKARLRSLQTSFRLIKTFVDEYEEELHALEVPVRLESLIRLWADYCTVQSELETLDDAGLEEYLKERAMYESAYYKVKGFLLSVNKSAPLSPTCASPTSHTHAHGLTSSSHVRLPDIKLPVFSGNLDHWLNFHDLYMSLVHSSTELSNIQKFYYLRASLSGDALKLVQTIPITAANYHVAWSLLEDHFQNKPRLKQSYLNALFESATLKRESAPDLHALVERFESNVKVLHQLGEKTEFWDLILIRMLSVRLDATTRRDWEEYSATKTDVTFKDLTSFIQRRVSVLQTLQGKGVETPPSSSSSSLGPPKKSTQRSAACHSATHANTDRKCLVCSEHHPLYMCPTFSKLVVEDKEKEIRRLQLCRNCLRKGHVVRECPSSSSCRKCKHRHHTQLCPGELVTTTTNSPSTTSKSAAAHTPEEQPRTSASVTVTEMPTYAASQKRQTTVLLATAVVLFVDDNGTEHAVRALLDSGSECCFVSERFLQSVSICRKKVSIPISGIGQSTVNAKFTVLSHIRSRVCNYSTTVECLVLPKLTMDLPSASIEATTWNIPPGVQLADPTFHKRNVIDLVLGADVFYDIFNVSGRIHIGDALPPLINSTFGWVVSGRTPCPATRRPLIANVATITELTEMMERFWTLEEKVSSSCHSIEEAACESHFQQTVSRDDQGRYIVRLPIKPDVLTLLGDNRRTAVRRFRMVEQRIAQSPQLCQQYINFMDEYSSLGHMRKVNDYETPPNPNYHLPHHAVLREESTTTKVRVVFDASCKTSRGPSLNDALMVGPIVQEELRSIIMRARTHPIMLIADIKQMFRQILVDERDTPLQRIVWRTSPDKPLDTYELKTVTYGTACAPFLATRVLHKLAEDEQDGFPAAAEVLRKDFYVDDLFSGADSVQDAIELREQLDMLLSKGGFVLRKWASNIPAVLDGVSPDNRALQSCVDFDFDQCIKTLGLYWEPSTDYLRYRISFPPVSPDCAISKRSVLSNIARLFDPIGLVGPVVTVAKLFMQELWLLKHEDGETWGWDEELPAAIKERWRAYCEQLPRLNELRIERWVLCPTPTSIQLHFFSDASKLAYGACCYLRSSNCNGTIKVTLLTARSRVAPLKQQSIPRLELCGALLATELFQKVAASLNNFQEIFFWVDSTIVLCWLKAEPTTWTTFVANRVSKIQQATQRGTWNHVAGQFNPADCISRGTSAETILEDDLWWHGPSWLHLEPALWPNQPTMSGKIVLPETRHLPISATTATVEPSFIDDLVSKFSNYSKLLRVVAYCRRFLQNVKATSLVSPYINTTELQDAEAVIVRLVQQQFYKEEWQALEKSQPISSKSKLRWFHPFLSTDRVMRIGGRIHQASQPFDKPNGRKSASEAKQTDKKDVKVKDDPGGGLPPAMEKSNSCSAGKTTSVSQQHPNLAAAENSGLHHHHHHQNHQPHHQQHQQHTSAPQSTAVASSASSSDLKYLHKKFKRIASASLSTVDDSGSESSKNHVTSAEALSRSTPFTTTSTTPTPTAIASAISDSGPVVAYSTAAAYLPNPTTTTAATAAVVVANSVVEPPVQQQPCANSTIKVKKESDFVVYPYEASAAVRFHPTVEQHSRTVIDGDDSYQSRLQLTFPCGTPDRLHQKRPLQQSNGASLNCVNHVSGASINSFIISNNHIPVKLEVSGDGTIKPYYPSVNNNSAINTSCDLNEKNQCSTTTGGDVDGAASGRSSNSSGSALSAHELATQAEQKYIVVLQQQQQQQQSQHQSPLYDPSCTNSVSSTSVEAVESPAVVTGSSNSGAGIPGKYMCPYCRLNCNKPSVLEKHIRRHTNERPFRCDPCGMAFKTKSNLYKHCRSRAHRSKFPDKDIGPTVDEDGFLGSDIEDKELSNSGSDIINRGSPMMDDRVHSPQLLVEKPYKPKFHNAALYAKFDGNKLGPVGGKSVVSTAMVINNSSSQQQHYISSTAGSGANYSSSNSTSMNGQNVESLEQHISKLISDNEAIVEVVELPLQKKYHKITGITRGISVNSSTSSGLAGSDSPSSKLANALLQKRNSEELQQQQLLMLQQQHQMQQQQLQQMQQQQQQQQHIQPYPPSEPTRPKTMVAQIPYVQNHHPPVGTIEVMHQLPPQQQQQQQQPQPQMVVRPISANELQPQQVQYQQPLNLSKPVPNDPPSGAVCEPVAVLAEPSRIRPPSESSRYSREQSPASSSSVQHQAPPSTSAVYSQQQQQQQQVAIPPSQPVPSAASQPVPVNDHPQNPERSIIKDLLLNSREFGVVQNPENENIEKLFTCKSCNTSFRDAEILKYHTVCFCKGNSSSLNSPDSAPMSPVGSPLSHYMRSKRFNPNSLKSLARGLLLPPSRNPAPLSKLAKSQLKLPRARPENISLPPKEGSSSRSSSSTSVSASESSAVPEVQTTLPAVAKVVDVVQNPLPSPGPLLGNTRLVDFQTSKASNEDTPPRKRQISPQDVGLRRPQHPSLQLFGGDLEVIERQDQMIPHRYSSGGTVTQYSPDADSEMSDSASMRARSSMHSGGTVVQLPKANRGGSPIPMNPTTPKLVVTITPTLTPSLTTPNFFPNASQQHQTPSERPDSNPISSSTVQQPISHFQFPPINSITAYNPLTLPQVSPGQASQIMHGGKMIPYVQGIPGPNSMLPSNEAQLKGRPRLAPSPISIKTPLNPIVPGGYMGFDPDDVVRNKKPVLVVPPVKNGMFKEIWSPAKQEISATPKKSFNFTRIADNISPRKKETIEPAKKEEIRYFNFENLISKSEIIIKPNTPTESIKPEPVETKALDVPPPPPVVQKPKFLRPNSLPLKPGTFTPKRHHGITPTNNTMPLISPETPRPSKSCRELYFNGHAYTNIGLKSSTKPFYCTVNKTQPFYVQTQKHGQLSMYSNWQVHPENDPHPLGFKPIQVMAMYNSSQQGHHSYSIATKPLTLLVVNSSSANQPISSAFEVKTSFPHSHYPIPQGASPAPKSSGFYPYLPEKSATSNDSIPPRSDSTERTLSGGFESTEEYTYVRGRGRGKYVCKECGIRCKKPSMLKKHIRTHTDVRPYSCQHCSFHFKTKGNLTKHMKSKSHFKKCTELGLNPIPISVDDDGGDIDIENDQQSISSEQTSTIPFDSDSDPDSDGEESDDSADYSEPKGGRLPEHEAAHCLLSLSMTPPTASQATKSYPSPVSSFGTGNQVPYERSRHPYAPTVSPGLSMSPQQSSMQSLPPQPQPAQKHLPMQSQPEPASQPHRRIITFGNTPKVEFNLLKHEQYYSDPSINKKKREYNPSYEEDDGAMPIDLTKKPKESFATDPAQSYRMYQQYPGQTVPKQPLADCPPSNLRSQVIVRVSDVVTPITGAANLLTTLVSNTDKIPLPLISNGSKELADDNVYFQEYIKQRALQDSKMKLSQMKSINNNQYDAEEVRPPVEVVVPVEQPSLVIAKPVPLKATPDKPYRIFNGKNDMLPKAVVEPTNRIEILPIVNEPIQEAKETVRVDNAETCVESVNTSRMETLAEVAAGSVKLPDAAGIDPVRSRSNSLIAGDAASAQPTASTSGAASSKESAKSVASEYLKLTKSVTMRKREDSESGTASDQETIAENIIIQPPIVAPIVPPVVVVPPAANPAPGEIAGIVARTVVVGEDGFRTSQAASEFPSLSPYQEDGGRPVCEVCHKKFHKISQLKIHMNIHYMERKFRCEPCGTSFRSQGLFQKHERSATHRNKVSMTTTFGIATDSNPRPFYCKDCDVGFRIHGHLAKHLRSKMHVLKLECLGKLPFGTYTEIERSGTNLTEIDTTDCENSLSSLKRLAVRLNVKDPANVLPGGGGSDAGPSGNETDSCDDNQYENDNESAGEGDSPNGPNHRGTEEEDEGDEGEASGGDYPQGNNNFLKRPRMDSEGGGAMNSDGDGDIKRPRFQGPPVEPQHGGMMATAGSAGVGDT